MPDSLWPTWPIKAALVSLALLIDAAVGDPASLPHPVILIGRLISLLDKRLRRSLDSPSRQRRRGLVVAIAVPVISAVVAALIVMVCSAIHPWVGFLAAAWLASTTVAARGLAQAAYGVLRPLQSGDLVAARRRVSEIVGRDTEGLSEAEIARAAVETVAENTVDACIAPLFFTLLAGAPGAMAYRAINTLDSMLGHKNETYLHFGWASARLDDMANWIPARLAGAIMPLAAILVGRNPWRSWRVILRDARKHPSPNAGIPEAAVAGALGIELGGLNFYQGIPEHRAVLGEGLKPLTKDHISQAVKIMIIASVITAFVLSMAAMLLGCYTAA